MIERIMYIVYKNEDYTISKVDVLCGKSVETCRLNFKPAVEIAADICKEIKRSSNKPFQIVFLGDLSPMKIVFQNYCNQTTGYITCDDNGHLFYNDGQEAELEYYVDHLNRLSEHKYGSQALALMIRDMFLKTMADSKK